MSPRIRASIRVGRDSTRTRHAAAVSSASPALATVLRCAPPRPAHPRATPAVGRRPSPPPPARAAGRGPPPHAPAAVLRQHREEKGERERERERSGGGGGGRGRCTEEEEAGGEPRRRRRLGWRGRGGRGDGRALANGPEASNKGGKASGGR
ncbi:hypothetical protein PVAP13_4NG166122 [Panicum virgatum]|uniref:Uncharacterized protein n=1 Tax=Panicum virgatum TaxID=38727 RepID=A0A8T0TA83_PANVG|nr:hypothetical protein PVAP13_4NG166122 [Panicum virgatum]